jgi:hypothetical protein
MVRFPWRFLGFSLAAAWAVDILFWKKPLGISFLIWSTLLMLFGVLLARGEKVKIARRSYILIAAVFLLSVFVLLRLEPFTQGVSLLFAVLLIFLLAVTFLNGHWFYYKAVDYVTAAFQVVVAAFSRPFDLSKTGGETEEPQQFGWKKVPGRLIPLLRGLVLALPVVLVLGALLAAADPIFSDWAENTLKIFNLDRFAEYLFRFFYIIVLAYLFTGLYLLAVRPLREAQQPDPDKPLFAGFLGWTETAVILASVNLLFAVFLIIQFRYFFGGETNIHATGYTYSEYARRGFGELVAVAVLSLLLYLGLGLVARLQQKRAQTGFTLLTALLILQVVVILVSAFQRLLLYESAYGFTRLRTYSHVFMVWLAILLAAVLVLEIVRKRGRFALFALIAAFGFCTSLAVLNVDGLVVRQNVRRAADSKLDSEYLKQLSSDAVPAMAGLFGTAKDQGVRDALGAELACRAVLLQEEALPWQGFTLSRAVARRTLTGMSDELAAYPVYQVEGDWMVSVGDQTQNCSWVPVYD